MKNDFTGRGWAFPPTFFAGGGEVSMVEGEEDIMQSLQILLSTSLNERVMLGDFGCALDSYLFEEIDQALVTNLERTISDAILNHEGRIKVDNVNVETDEAVVGLLRITVTYSIRTTNNRYNLVFPFYLNEANN